MTVDQLRRMIALDRLDIKIPDPLLQVRNAAWRKVQATNPPPYDAEPWDAARIAKETGLDQQVIEGLQVMFILTCCVGEIYCQPTREHYLPLANDYLDAIANDQPPTRIQHWPIHRCCCTYESEDDEPAQTALNGSYGTL